MAEGVTIVAGDEDDLGLDRLAQSLAELGRGQLRAGGGEDAVLGPARHRQHPQRRPRGRRQPFDPQQQRVAQGAGEAAAAVGAGGEQLLGEQRVALAALEEALDRARAGVAAEDVGELGGELVAAERLQLDPPHPLAAAQLGQQRAQRVAPVELVGAVRDDRQQRAVLR